MCFSKRNHFRKNNSKNGRGHPAYIFKEENGEYKYIGLTHSNITQGVKNIKLDHNPNKKDKRDSYIRNFSTHDKTKKFGKKLKGWKLNRSDKDKIKKSKKNYKE